MSSQLAPPTLFSPFTARLVIYQSGQRHARNGADQLDRLAVVDVTVPHSELLSL